MKMVALVEFKPYDNKISLFSFGSCQGNRTWQLDCEGIVVGTCMCLLLHNKFKCLVFEEYQMALFVWFAVGG